MNINEFVSHLKKSGVAKTNRFKVEVYPPNNLMERYGSLSSSNARDLAFACESAEFPGRTLATSDNRIYGPAFKTPYGTDYAEINLTFLCSENLVEKQFFDDWIDYINPTTNFTFKYREDYIADVKVIQYNELNEQTYACRLYGAFPVAVNALQGNWADDGLHRVQVTMTYRFWEQIVAEPSFVSMGRELDEMTNASLGGSTLYSVISN